MAGIKFNLEVFYRWYMSVPLAKAWNLRFHSFAEQFHRGLCRHFRIKIFVWYLNKSHDPGTLIGPKSLVVPPIWYDPSFSSPRNCPNQVIHKRKPIPGLHDCFGSFNTFPLHHGVEANVLSFEIESTVALNPSCYEHTVLFPSGG